MNSKLTGEGDEDDDEDDVQKKLQVSFEHRDENKSCSAWLKDHF